MSKVAREYKRCETTGCRNRVWRGFPKAGLCKRCVCTPDDIRARELNGCMTIRMMPRGGWAAEQERYARAAALNSAAPSTHRKRFKIVGAIVEPIERKL